MLPNVVSVDVREANAVHKLCNCLWRRGHSLRPPPHLQRLEDRLLFFNDQVATAEQRCHGRMRQPADITVSQRLKLLLTQCTGGSHEHWCIEINAERPRPDAAVGRQVPTNRGGYGIEERGHIQSLRRVQQRHQLVVGSERA